MSQNKYNKSLTKGLVPSSKLEGMMKLQNYV